MSAKKEIDRHVDEPDTPYSFRIFVRDLEAIRKIAKREDRTRGAVLREAVRLYLEGRKV
jgi:Ribbon-helix-helix protein, copG family